MTGRLCVYFPFGPKDTPELQLVTLTIALHVLKLPRHLTQCSPNHSVRVKYWYLMNWENCGLWLYPTALVGPLSGSSSWSKQWHFGPRVMDWIIKLLTVLVFCFYPSIADRAVVIKAKGGGDIISLQTVLASTESPPSFKRFPHSYLTSICMPAPLILGYVLRVKL